MLVFAVFISVTSVSCSKDSDDDDSKKTEEEIGGSLADQVSGTYVGQLANGSTVIEDAYAITVTKLNDVSVSVNAKFFSGKDYNFTLTQSGNQILFSNTTMSNITMYVIGSTLYVSYLTSGGNMNTYTGKK